MNTLIKYFVILFSVFSLFLGIAGKMFATSVPAGIYHTNQHETQYTPRELHSQFWIDPISESKVESDFEFELLSFLVFIAAGIGFIQALLFLGTHAWNSSIEQINRSLSTLHRPWYILYHNLKVDLIKS